MKRFRDTTNRWATTACEQVSRAADPWLSWMVEVCFAGDASRGPDSAPSLHALAAGAVHAGSVVVDLALPTAGPLVDLGRGLAVAAVAAHSVARVAARHPRAPRYLPLLVASVRGARDRGAPCELVALACDLACGASLPMGPLAIVLARGLVGRVRHRAVRRAGAWLPVLGAVARAYDAAHGVARAVRWVSAVEREAEALCAARGARVLVLRRVERVGETAALAA